MGTVKDMLWEATQRINSLEATIREQEAELTAYREAALYDAMMDGPRFKGWDRSALDRARKITEAKR